MKKKNELAKNTIIISIGKICTQFMTFFLLPLYTSVLTTEEYGLVDLFSTYTSLLLPIIIMQIDQALFRYMIDQRDNKAGMEEIVSTAISFVCFQTIILVLVFSLIQPFVQLQYKWYLLLFLCGTIWSTMSLQLARGFGKNVIYSLGSFLSAATQILFNILFLLGFKWGVEGMLTATVLGHFCCAFFLLVKLKVHKYVHFDGIKLKSLKTLLSYSVPLIPNALCWWALNASDRLIVSTVLGVGYNGLCAIGHKFTFIVITFYNIFNISWTESAAIHINDEDRDKFFGDVISSMFKLFSCMCIGILAVMPFAFSLLVKGDFGEAYDLIPVYMIASLFNVLVGLYSVVYVALKKTKEIAKTSLYSGIINLIVHLLTINYIGVYAAPLSSAVAFGIMGIYRYVDIQKYISVRLNRFYVVQLVCIYIVICLGYYSESAILQIVMLAITVLFCLVHNKKMLYEILNKVKNRRGME